MCTDIYYAPQHTPKMAGNHLFPCKILQHTAAYNNCPSQESTRLPHLTPVPLLFSPPMALDGIRKIKN